MAISLIRFENVNLSLEWPWRRRGRHSHHVPYWDARLSTSLEGARVLGWGLLEPEVQVVSGVSPLEEHVETTATQKRLALAEEGRPNDAHGLVVNQPLYSADPVLFEVQPLDFAHVSVLRGPDPKAPKPLPLLSANVLIVCPEEKVLLLNKRSMEVATYKGALHTFGGAFAPPYRGAPHDKRSLRWTAMREVFEESNVILSWETTPVLYLEETLTGFIQAIYLGVQVTSAMLHKLEVSWEGIATRIPFDRLHQELLKFERPLEQGESPEEPRPYWVPTAKAGILGWLAFGAPGAGRKVRFERRTASELFELHVST